MHRPAAPVSDAVERMWVVHGRQPFGAVYVPPAPALQIVFNLGDAYLVNGVRCPETWVEGVWERPITTRAIGATFLVGIQLHPWGAARLSGGIGAACAGRLIDAECALGPGTGELRERLHQAPTDVVRFAVLEAFLACRLRERRLDVEAALRLVTRSGGGASIDAIARSVGLDARTFRRQCQRLTGISPKRLARLTRFDRSIGALSGRETVRWSDFAQVHGFYDQSHMIREWRSLLGMSPSEFMARRATFGQYVVPVDAPPSVSDLSNRVDRSAR